ncbi:UDP-N-acetylmuramoyl-tripeptide--D-alanyl-D-alanine ligase, partial [Candidatus Venteria ishoeyi]|uniref:UDP-N-acetylmuramoyl-tripeptide--D-alanyl-D- alanine ligase n=1 Tax=Candidatus Venteria ishoeyi TaxID=1899563 RepID=UPI000AFC89BD
MIEASLAQISRALLPLKISGADDTRFQGCSIDSRSLQAGSLYLALRGERFDGHDFCATAVEQGAVALLVEQRQALNVAQILVQDSHRALAELAAWWRKQNPARIIAITGSNGKTSVKEMTTAILRQSTSQPDTMLATQGNLNNEIGVPLTLLNLNAHHRFAVIEMGANNPGEIARLSHWAQPQIALITQCAPAHLEGFGSIEGVARAKGEIYQALNAQGMAIINQDDQYADYWSGLTEARHLSFGLTDKADIFASDIRLNSESSFFHLHTPVGDCEIQLPLPGQHNIYNALAASACCLSCGLSLNSIQAGLSQLQAVAGRLQAQAGLRNSRIFDDSYNANPGSLKAGLNVLANCPTPRWLVLGDMLELGEQAQELHAQVGQLAKQAGIERVLTLGELSLAATENFGSNAQHFSDKTALIAHLQQTLPENCQVLIKGSRGSAMEQVVRQ